MEWIKSLKPGDKVFLRHNWTPRMSREAVVEKVGRKWITFNNRFQCDKETGRFKEQNYEIWRSKEEYILDVDRHARWLRISETVKHRELRRSINASDEVLNQIEQLLGMERKNLIFNPPIRNQ